MFPTTAIIKYRYCCIKCHWQSKSYFCFCTYGDVVIMVEGEINDICVFETTLKHKHISLSIIQFYLFTNIQHQSLLLMPKMVVAWQNVCH